MGQSHLVCFSISGNTIISSKSIIIIPHSIPNNKKNNFQNTSISISFLVTSKMEYFCLPYIDQKFFDPMKTRKIAAILFKCVVYYGVHIVV